METTHEAGKGYCLKCNLETQPNMLCKCPERQSSGDWNPTR